MISAETIAGLEDRGLEYILGVRERSSKEVREVVLADPAPERATGDPAQRPARYRTGGQGGRRSAIGDTSSAATSSRLRRRPAPARRSWRRCAPSSAQGDKALVGNSAYRRYLKTPG